MNSVSSSTNVVQGKIILFTLLTLTMFAGCTQGSQLQADLRNTCFTQTTNPQLLDMFKNYSQDNKDQIACPKDGDRIAIIETDLGTIKMKVFEKEVPTLAQNFLGLVNANKYVDVPFHRVMKNFMIQTGDFTDKNGMGGYSYKGPDTYLPNEINLKVRHLYGTVSMAKTAAPVSIGSQFFIVTNKNGVPGLDGDYSPIGQVYEGMDVAEAIVNLQVPGTEEPSKAINIKKITTAVYAGK